MDPGTLQSGCPRQHLGLQRLGPRATAQQNLLRHRSPSDGASPSLAYVLRRYSAICETANRSPASATAPRSSAPSKMSILNAHFMHVYAKETCKKTLRQRMITGFLGE